MLKRTVLIITPIVCGLFLLFVLVSWFSGDIILDYGRYFAVDETGCVYLGVGQSIYVYKDSALVNKFLVGRGKHFTIVDDEIWTYDVNTTRYTLTGEKISTSKGGESTIYKQYRYISQDGTKYRIRYPLGRFSVREENSGKYIYQMPVRDYLLGIAGMVALCILATWCAVMALGYSRNWSQQY